MRGKIPLPAEGVAGEARRGSVGRRSPRWMFHGCFEEKILPCVADTTPALRATPFVIAGNLDRNDIISNRDLLPLLLVGWRFDARSL